MQGGQLTVDVKEGEKIAKWCVVKELGRGTYGAVYKVIEEDSKREAAMKVESREIPAEHRMLSYEASVMKKLRNSKCKNCVKILETGKTPKFNYLVMNLVGPNLETLANKMAKPPNTPGVFSLYTVFYTGLQTIETLEDMHKKILLHRDIKPQNFAIGCGLTDYKCIYLLDFGTARQFARENGLHHRPRAKVAFKGSTLYASASALMQVDQGRRDDVWSWLFMMVRLTVGHLPWSNMESAVVTNYEEHLQRYADIKDELIDQPDNLLRGCPPEFRPIWKSMQGLLFYSRPNYELIAEKLREGLQRTAKEAKDVKLDWEQFVLPKTEPTPGPAVAATTSDSPKSEYMPRLIREMVAAVRMPKSKEESPKEK